MEINRSVVCTHQELDWDPVALHRKVGATRDESYKKPQLS